MDGSLRMALTVGLRGTGSWQNGQQDIKMIKDNKNAKFAPLFNGEKIGTISGIVLEKMSTP